MSVDYTHLANRIKLLAHPERLRILAALRYEPQCVCHLTALLEKPQPYVSQQLGLLRQARVIDDEKTGLNVYYRLADAEIGAWLDEILGEAGSEQSEMSPNKILPNCSCPKCASEQNFHFSLSVMTTKVI